MSATDMVAASWLAGYVHTMCCDVFDNAPSPYRYATLLQQLGDLERLIDQLVAPEHWVNVTDAEFTNIVLKLSDMRKRCLELK